MQQILGNAIAGTSRICKCSTTAKTAAKTTSFQRRTIASTSARSAKLLEHKLVKDNDPMDMQNLRDFDHDDVPLATHLVIEKDRTKLHMLRLIQFQLPQLRNARRPFVRPPQSQFMELRSQHHLGDPSHPASRKAVLTLRLTDLVRIQKILTTKEQQHKFKLLAGSRWNPEKDTLKISCEMFPTFFMNAKWCSDTLDRLINEAEDTTDPMSDIALDTRHSAANQAKKGKKKATSADFPKEWLPENVRAKLGNGGKLRL